MKVLKTPQIPNATRWNSHDASADIFLKNYQNGMKSVSIMTPILSPTYVMYYIE